MCFEFMTKTVVIAHQYFSCCRAALTQSPELFCFSHCPVSKDLGVHKELREDTASTTDPDWPKGCPTPYHRLTGCQGLEETQKKKLGEGMKEGGHTAL